MQSKHLDGQELNLRRLSDTEYERAKRLAPTSLDECPTCGGKEERYDDGIKRWRNREFRYRDQVYECNCYTQLALYTRYLLANIGTQYMRLDWAEFGGTKEAAQWVQAYIENWNSYFVHGFGLTFSSRLQGVGKTWSAAHIGKELIKQRQKVYFQGFVPMIDAFCDRDKDVENRMKEAHLLILDDIVTGISDRQNDLYALKFEVVIRHRTNYNLPTIFTTNLTETEFEEEFSRIYSLISPKQKWISMNGVDHRKKQATAEETEEMILKQEVRPIS